MTFFLTPPSGAGRWQRLQALGVNIDYRELCARWETKLVPVYLGRREYWEAFREFLGELGLAPGAMAEVLGFARQKAAEIEHRALFDGVAETLDGLKGKGLKLAVLSDTESQETRVRRRLADLGIEQYFNAVVTSVDIGHVKPQPEAFAAALARLQVSAAEAAFVGHDADELEGARQSGITAVAFNHEDGVVADCYVEHFRDLLPLADQQ